MEMNKRGLKKIAVRFLIVNVVYLLIKLTIEHDDGSSETLEYPDPDVTLVLPGMCGGER